VSFDETVSVIVSDVLVVDSWVLVTKDFVCVNKRVVSECLLFGIFVLLLGTVVVGFPTTMDRIFLVVDTFSDVDFPGKLVLGNTAESKVVNGC